MGGYRFNQTSAEAACFLTMVAVYQSVSTNRMAQGYEFSQDPGNRVDITLSNVPAFKWHDFTPLTLFPVLRADDR